jgi:hypothetical protein
MAFTRVIPMQFYERLSPRERVLALAVAGVVFALANVMGVSALLGAFTHLRQEGADAALELKAEDLFARDQPKWDKRTAWLRTVQPTLISRDRAGAALLEQVQAAARGAQVATSNERILPLPPQNTADGHSAGTDYQAVQVEVETKSDWTQLVNFLQAVQRPDQFLVVDLASWRSDPSDPTRLKGQFMIAKWYTAGSASR